MLPSNLPPFLCARDGAEMAYDGVAAWTCACGERMRLVEEGLLDGTGHHSGEQPREDRDEQIKLAYRFYALVYPVVALFAMWFVWKGKLRRLVRFYADRLREAAADPVVYVDIGTGDGSLTGLALKEARLDTPPSLLSVDLSLDMLRKARRKLRRFPRRLRYVQSVNHLNLPPGSLGHVGIYGAIHVLNEPQPALTHVASLLREDGELHGSILMSPGRRWADRVAAKAIAWGLLSRTLTEAEIDELFRRSGLTIFARDHNGRMLLFRARRAGALGSTAGSAEAAGATHVRTPALGAIGSPDGSMRWRNQPIALPPMAILHPTLAMTLALPHCGGLRGGRPSTSAAPCATGSWLRSSRPSHVGRQRQHTCPPVPAGIR